MARPPRLPDTAIQQVIDELRARRGTDIVTLLHPVGYNFFATLRQKLHWSVMRSEPHSRA
jgi:NAD+ kinase